MGEKMLIRDFPGGCEKTSTIWIRGYKQEDGQEADYCGG
jgi:hypothetical protein